MGDSVVNITPAQAALGLDSADTPNASMSRKYSSTGRLDRAGLAAVADEGDRTKVANVRL